MFEQKKTILGPLVLAIIDGWGIAPDSESNPITHTSIPGFKKLYSEGKHTRLWAHGEYVGLPKDQDGNSEAGHLNLGAGRIVKQDGVIITEAIKDGTFFKNPALIEAVQHVERNNSSMHLVGMLSDGQSAHATPEHLYALLDLMNRHGVERVYLHLFADGRDSAPNSGKFQLEEVIDHLKPCQHIATVMGRFYGMDRKKQWSRTALAYAALVLGKGVSITDPLSIFDKYYSEGKSDEFIEPHVILENGKPVGIVQDNDSVIFFNHRSDRARQLTKPFVQKDFNAKNPGSFVPDRVPKNVRFVALTDFGPDLGDILTAYPSIDVEKALPAVLSSKRQLYIAESEKYAHMTYFFNGGYAQPIGGEDRLMIPSPDVKHYDETPAMSTSELTQAVLKGVDDGYDFIALNYACTDMIAHTGNFEAAKMSIQAVDQSLALISNRVGEKEGALIVTADHGNIEEMKNLSTNGIDTEHSKNQVPFILWCSHCIDVELREEGLLADVAPTILDIFGISKPSVMTGKSLLMRPDHE